MLTCGKELVMQTKTTILIFSDWFTPAFKAGGPIRSVVNMVERLKDDCEIYVFARDRDLHDTVPFQGITPDQWIEANGFKIQYYSPGKLKFRKVRSLIHEIQPDKIYLNSMFSNMIFPLLAAANSGKVILAPRGMLRISALAVKPIRKFFYLSFLKTMGVEKQICFHATSEEEVKDIKRVFPLANKIRVAANLPIRVIDRLTPITKSSGELKLIFVGRIHPIKNLLFLLEAIEALYIDAGDVASNNLHLQLTIAATIDDGDYWDECQQAIARLQQYFYVDLHLDCQHDQVKYLLSTSHLFVLPTQGENFGHAIFEALAVGCPVLISDQTPWRELQSCNAGLDLPLSDRSGFNQAISTFAMMDNPEWQKYRKGALTMALNHEKSTDSDRTYIDLFKNAE